MAEPAQYIGLVPFKMIEFPIVGGGTTYLARHQIVAVIPKNAGETHVLSSNNNTYKVPLGLVATVALITAP